MIKNSHRDTESAEGRPFGLEDAEQRFILMRVDIAIRVVGISWTGCEYLSISVCSVSLCSLREK